jgi:hypothetical protein
MEQSMISITDKKRLLGAYERAEMDHNPEFKCGKYEEALEITKDISEEAEVAEERRLISNIRLANCRSMVKFLAVTGTLTTNALVTRYMGLIHEFRAELQALIEQDADVRDEISRFFGKQKMVPHGWALAVTKMLLGEATPA